MPDASQPSPTPSAPNRPSGDPRPSEAAELELGSLQATLNPVAPPRPALFARLSLAMTFALATLFAGCTDRPEIVAPPGVRGPNYLVMSTIAVAEVGAGTNHTCALRPDGSAACWGNDYFQQSPPIRSATGGGVFVRVSTGAYFACGLRADGVAECWGLNNGGQAPASRAASTPGTNFVDLATGGSHSCARRDDGAVECWGYNGEGQVGSVPATQYASDVHAGPYTSVSAGNTHTCAVTVAGAVDCWGDNSSGQAPSHREASGGATFVTVSGGGYHSCALNSLGVAECWGHNYDGQAPASRSASNGAKFVQLSTGTSTTCAVNTLGIVECWGQNRYDDAPPTRSPGMAGTTFTQVSAGYQHTCMRRSDAQVECYGWNSSGQTTVPVIRSYPTATLGVAPSAVAVGQSFTLSLSNAKVPGATGSVTFTYAFDCGAGYGAFGSSATATCPAIFIGAHGVGAKVRDQDGDVTESRGTIQVSAPPPPPSTTSLLYWDVQNATTAGDVSSAPSTTALAGVTGRLSQTCGGPAESFGGTTGTVLVTRRFGTCYPYFEFTLTRPTYLVNVTFDHWHNHNDNQPTAPNYRAQLQLDAASGYADVGAQWLLEGNNVPHVGADGATIALDRPLQPGTYRLRWMPRGLNPYSRWVCSDGGDPAFCDDAHIEYVNNPVDTDQQYFAVKNVRLNGYALWAFTGFLAPVDNAPTVNTAKAGSAIPVKFGLGGDRGLAVFAAGYPQAQQISCDNSAPTDAIDQTVTAGASGLSYDAATQLYSYAWKTDKAWANSCRLLTVKLVDGTTKTASFKFK